MQVEILGDGKTAAYEINGTIVKVVDINGSYMEIDCNAIQEDSAVIVDICRDGAGNLVNGIKDAISYVASITIPPHEKYEQPKLNEDGEPIIDENGNQVYEVVVSPINMGKVRLTLWPLAMQVSNSNKDDKEEE
jgi:hypothetical protein